MRRTEAGVLLRLLGPLIQILSLLLVMSPSAARMSDWGFSARHIGYGGFLLGLGMVVVGLILSRRSRP